MPVRKSMDRNVMKQTSLWPIYKGVLKFYITKAYSLYKRSSVQGKIVTYVVEKVTGLSSLIYNSTVLIQ